MVKKLITTFVRRDVFLWLVGVPSTLWDIWLEKNNRIFRGVRETMGGGVSFELSCFSMDIHIKTLFIRLILLDWS